MKLAIFDLDGTLVNSLADIAEATKQCVFLVFLSMSFRNLIIW